MDVEPDSASPARLRFSLLFAVAVLSALAGRASAQDSWETGAPLPTPRRLLAAAAEGGTIYTFGGCGSPCFSPPAHTSTEEETRLEVYQGGGWWTRQRIPAILFGAAAAAPGNDRIYLFGGFVTGSSTYEYDPADDRWERKSPMPTPRHGLAAVAWGGKVYVLGGSDGQRASAALEIYDPDLDSWTLGPPMPTARVFLAAAEAQGKIYAIGGSPDCCGNDRTDAVEVYDPAARTWSRARSLPEALQVSAAAAANGKVYVFGGFIPGSGTQSSTLEYDPATNDWISRTPLPVGRDQAPAVASGDKIFVLGGSVDCHCRARDDTSEYTPPVVPDTEKPKADLRITKRSVPDEFSGGDLVRYTIIAENAGPGAVTAATIEDLVPAALTGVAWTCEASVGGRCSLPAGRSLDDQIDLGVGSSVTYTLTGILDPAAAEALTELANTASVEPPADVSDPEASNNSDTEIDRIVEVECRVSITKDDGRAEVAPGDVPVYEITLRNECPAAASVTVTDLLASTGLEDVRWCRGTGTGCGPSTPGDLVDTLTIPAGGTEVYRASGTVPCACGLTRIVNTACVSPGGCTEPDVDRIEPAPAANLALDLTGPDSLGPGATGAYAFEVTNGGPCTARDVVLEIQPPAGFGVVSIAPPCEPGLPCRVRLGDLPSGSTAGVAADFQGPLVCGAAGTASASVASSCSDPVPGNNADALDTRVLYDLAISKTDNLTQAAPGDLTAYRIEVENRCAVAVEGARVTDLFPPELEDVQWCPLADCAARFGDLVTTVDLAANEARYFYVSARISAAFSGTLRNTATIELPGGFPDATPQDNSATDETLIVPAPGGTAFCAGIAGTPIEGAEITYTFVLWNGGPEAQEDNPGDELVDTLPAGLTLTGATADSGTISTAANTVTWNGAIPAGGHVTIRVEATIDAGTLGMTLCNQATFSFDADGDGINESSVLTDDPELPGPSDPCCFEVLPSAVAVIPTLSDAGLLASTVLLALLALRRFRRRAE